LANVLAEATRLSCGRCQFDARLALAEIEMKEGKKAVAHEHLASLEKDASAKGFLLVAHEAHAAASK
jgi:hypothetical protein